MPRCKIQIIRARFKRIVGQSRLTATQKTTPHFLGDTMRVFNVLCAVVIGLVTMQTVRADEPTAIDKLVEYHNQNAAEAVKGWRATAANYSRAAASSRRAPITGMTAGPPGGGYTSFKSKDIKLQILANLATEAGKAKGAADDIEHGRRLVAPQLPFPPKVGNIGAPSATLHVEKVLDKTSLIIRDNRPPITTRLAGDSHRIQVGKSGDVSFVLEGVSTAGVSDNSGYAMPEVVEVTGTKSLKWEDGTETLLVLRPVDTAAVLAKIEPLKKIKGK